MPAFGRCKALHNIQTRALAIGSLMAFGNAVNSRQELTITRSKRLQALPFRAAVFHGWSPRRSRNRITSLSIC